MRSEWRSTGPGRGLRGLLAGAWRAALLAWLLVPALAAAGGTADLREALGHVPRSVLGAEGGWLSFNGMAQIRRVLGGQEVATHLVLGRGAPLDALGVDHGSAFADRAGVSLQEIRYFVQFGRAPHEVVLWGM